MLNSILIIFGFLICFFLAVMAIDCNRFITVNYELKSKKIAKECTFVLLSDLHNKSFGKDNERLIKKIDEIAPNAVLAAGDMLTSAKGEKYVVAVRLMEQLSAKYPIYYGMGNHEHRMRLNREYYGNSYELYEKALHNAGIEPLMNENVDMPSFNINICGLMIDRCYYRKFHKYPMQENYLRDIIGQAKSDKFQILIAHNPDYFEEYVKWGADLTVSGHVHGGLMRLPVIGGVVSPRLTLFPKYDGGRFEKDNKVMILSRGLATHTLPIRIFNPGELVVIHLSPA